MAHLGEPLPLPYRPTSAVKTEDDNPDESMDIALEVPRRRKISPLGHRDRVLEETRVLSPRSLPVWHQKAASLDKSTKLPSLGTMERKIQKIREVFQDADDNETRQLEEKLDDINQQLENILEQRHENSLVEELERLQQHNPHLHPTEEGTRRRYIIFAVIALLLASSFVVGNLSYDYCYYLCLF